MSKTSALRADRESAGASGPRSAEGPIWLVFAEMLSNRIFFECGIVEALRRAYPDRLTAVAAAGRERVTPWVDRLEGVPLIDRSELQPWHVPFGERVSRRLDIELDRRVGFYPLAIRHSLHHGFHTGRFAPGHRNWFLDSNRKGPLPSVGPLDRLLARRHFSGRRYIPGALLERVRDECGGIVLANLQAYSSVPYLTAARKLGVKVVGYVASWDHPVGKGLISPHLHRYLVQNEEMKEALVRYHDVPAERIVVTGWPQTDVFHRRRAHAEYELLAQRLGLDPKRPVVLYAGNTPTNQPYEANMVERLVEWWSPGARHEQFQLLFRPHPRDGEVAERYAAAFRAGATVQEASYTDFEDLATLLQNVGCVVGNGGTILLDALVNDRPTVCITFDEGAPSGEERADLNLGGEHYRALFSSDAIYRADDFAGLTEAIERALTHPEERAAARRRIVAETVGEVDGRAVERVAAAIVNAFEVTASRSEPLLAAGSKVR